MYSHFQTFQDLLMFFILLNCKVCWFYTIACFHVNINYKMLNMLKSYNILMKATYVV